jgi:UDP-glucose 4-epimerase
MGKILVTGGAGYIGSAAVKALIEKGHQVVVVDNLSKGLKRLVHPKAEFHQVDLTDKEKLEGIFSDDIDEVIHFAAYKAVGESMKNPKKYNDNIIGMQNLLDVMVKHKVKKIIFSSSAAVYGIPSKGKITEESKTDPLSYYGFTKLVCEELIQWYSRIYGIDYVILRYFNVAGDAGLKYIDPDAENIFPILMEAATGKRDKVEIYGTDYDTRDGTGVRDYIDINDLVEAHILALDKGHKEIINLGTSNGVTVRELIDATFKVTGEFPVVEVARRPGDPPEVIASNDKAKRILKWQPKGIVKDMIKSTYEAYE